MRWRGSSGGGGAAACARRGQAAVAGGAGRAQRVAVRSTGRGDEAAGSTAGGRARRRLLDGAVGRRGETEWEREMGGAAGVLKK